MVTHMSKSAPVIISTVAVAAMIGGWAAFGLQSSEMKQEMAVDAASGGACTHEKGVAAGLTNYLPSDGPKQAPQTTFRDDDDNVLSLADLKGQGLVVNFWATWCAPCVAEMPALDRLDAEMADQGIRVIAINEDRNPDAVAPGFYEETGLTSLGLYADEGMQLAREASVSGLPTTLLINRNGDEVGAVVGPAEWDAPEIEAFLKSCLLAGG